MLSALAEGRSEIIGLNPGADVRATAACLEALGVDCRARDDRGVLVKSPGARSLREPERILDAGNSGTTLRCLAGVVASVPGVSVLTGDESLRRRPMARVVEPLRSMGADIDGRAGGRLAPIVVRGRPLTGADIRSSVPSAQVKTAVLLAGLAASGTTSVTEPIRSRNHTETMLRNSGVEVEVEGRCVRVRGGRFPRPQLWKIPADASAALFPLVAALIVPGSEVVVRNMSLNPTRTAALKVLCAMGADVEVTPTGETCGEPVGDVVARASSLTGVAVDPALAPALMDEVPILAVAASQAEGETSFSGVGELRVKESDRIAAVADGLRRLSGHCEELPDGLVVLGPTRLEGGEVDSRGDHRVAMAFAVAGLVASANVRVAGWGCVETSFPSFAGALAKLRAGE